MEIVIITGMSGAGKSSALNIFEDMGYYCMDNVPPQLMPAFMELAQNAKDPIDKTAVGVDIRGGHFFESLNNSISQLESMQAEVRILFLDATDDVLIRRYKELRRPHPMDKAGNIFDGIQRERLALRDLKAIADLEIDSSNLTLGQFKEVVDQMFLPGAEEKGLVISVTSFGFKNGILLDADLVFDARFIPNPFYIEEYRDRSGLDEEVRDYIFSFAETNVFVDKILDLLEYLLPFYEREGKRTLSVGIGCTGGRHRSAAIAKLIFERLKEDGELVVLNHRDKHTW